tara:strand:- start:1470 stop:2291 length:822 start_codon:yes stop_codon:yes gene_type:complete
LEEVKKISNELLEGKGYIIIPSVFSPNDIEEAHRLITFYLEHEEEKTTHFQGKNKDTLHLQKRVWNLLNKGDIFVKMVQVPLVVKIVQEFLGSEVCLGSIAANCIFPGGPGQEPHIDYPYWDMYKKESFPKNINASFPLNCQVTILLNDFTVENGATGVLPYTQKLCRYPDEKDTIKYFEECERMTGKAGDIAIFNGLTWHGAMPNNSSNEVRNAILLQYLPKFVKPMEDQKRGVKKEVIDNASPILRQLLGLDYPYPKVLDEDEAINAEGRD